MSCTLVFLAGFVSAIAYIYIIIRIIEDEQ